jgi:hypothetical protein
MNNEPKSSQVCINESTKLWAEVSQQMSPEERADCEKVAKVIERKTQMERQNTNVIGAINEYAFLKSTAEVKVAAASKAAVKPWVNPKYDWY